MQIEKISPDRDPKKLMQDIERYAKLAIDVGASASAIITTEQISVDERVIMKCRFPLCGEYGQCMNCPPNTGSIEDMRRRVKQFDYAIILKLDVASERIAGAAARGEPGVEDLKKLCKIISDVESAAFYDGHYFSTGFSSASCHFIWCQGIPCQALEGKGCRQRARVYTSMEAVGIDVFHLMASVGWDIYPVGMSATADMFAQGSRCGLVLIG